jgi:uncharacterized protein YndB with AHSA1/START domain
MTFGTVTNFDESATVRFERIIGAAVEVVWNALTDPTEIAAWLAPAGFDTRAGGNVSIDFGEGGTVAGAITEFEPLRVLEYTWTFTGERDSVLRFELTADGAKTKLVLEHRLLPPDQAVGYGAGWHAHLDMFGAHVTNATPVDWDERFTEVLGAYAGA